MNPSLLHLLTDSERRRGVFLFASCRLNWPKLTSSPNVVSDSGSNGVAKSTFAMAGVSNSVAAVGCGEIGDSSDASRRRRTESRSVTTLCGAVLVSISPHSSSLNVLFSLLVRLLWCHICATYNSARALSLLL